MGLAIADTPEGPYVKHTANPIVQGGHEVLVWPYGKGVFALINIGPEGIRKTLRYAEDGIVFQKIQDLDAVPTGPGAYRPEAFTDSGAGTMIDWGVHIGKEAGFFPFLEHFDCDWQRATMSGRY